MIVREPNGEPKLLMISSKAGLCEASRGTRDAAFVRELIPGGRAWQRMPLSLSRPGPDAEPAGTGVGTLASRVRGGVGTWPRDEDAHVVQPGIQSALQISL